MAIMHDRIKELRNNSGLTLAQIADKLDVTEATAQRYETGKGIKTVPYEVIEKYANIFNCTPQYIMGWEAKIKAEPEGMAQLHVEMIMDDDFVEMFEDFRKLDAKEKQIVKKFIHSMVDSEA